MVHQAMTKKTRSFLRLLNIVPFYFEGQRFLGWCNLNAAGSESAWKGRQVRSLSLWGCFRWGKTPESWGGVALETNGKKMKEPPTRRWDQQDDRLFQMKQAVPMSGILTFYLVKTVVKVFDKDFMPVVKG